MLYNQQQKYVTPKKLLPGRSTWVENNMVNTIEYSVKPRQLKTTIINCTEVQWKGFKISNANKKYVGTYNMYVMQLL